MLKKVFSIILTLMSLILVVALQPHSIHADNPDREYGSDLAYKRRVVSTPHTDDNFNEKAVDGLMHTRYASQGLDDAFFYIDLGSIEKVGKIVLDFEAAYATQYLIQLSMDAITWTTIAEVTNTEATIDEIELPEFIEAQFVRFQGVERGTQYGYSFYRFEVYGPKNLAAGSDVYAVSSNENAVELNRQYITDNDAKTRWASAVLDDQWVLIDLLEAKNFDMVKIRWEVSFARRFRIYMHPSLTTQPDRDDAGWAEIVRSDVGLGEVDTFKLSGVETARFLKIELIQRETSEATKKTGRLPFESTFSIYEFELYRWDDINAIPLGHVLEFSQNAPAWTAMSNITLNASGLILAPIGYPIEADGVVTNLASIADGDIPGFESYAVYNPAVIYDKERQMFHMIYRAELPDNFRYYFMGEGRGKYELGHMSTLAYAYSYDGVHYERGENNPIAWPTSSDEAGGGLEDPRMFVIENDPARGGLTTYYITYTMYDNSVTREGIIYTHDFVTFHKHGRLAPDFNAFGGAIKSGSYVTDPEGHAVMIEDPRPGKSGKVYMIYMKDGSYTRIGFTTDVLHINPEDIIDIDTSNFGPNDIEALTKGNESCMALTNLYGPDDEDIYLMYGGGVLSDASIQYAQPNASGWFYALGVLKTTKSNPFELTHVSWDLDEPMMYPTDTNKIDYGLFNKCMFADTMIRQDNTWYFYYGAGDMYVGLATARGDFTAGGAKYVRDGHSLDVSTMALNKAYGDDKTARNIDFISEIYALDGTLIDIQVTPYAIDHFSHLSWGVYARGVPVSHTIDLEGYDLEANFYVTTYLKDSPGTMVLNQRSTYVVIEATVSSVPNGGVVR